MYSLKAIYLTEDDLEVLFTLLVDATSKCKEIRQLLEVPNNSGSSDGAQSDSECLHNALRKWIIMTNTKSNAAATLCTLCSVLKHPQVQLDDLSAQLRWKFLVCKGKSNSLLFLPSIVIKC